MKTISFPMISFLLFSIFSNTLLCSAADEAEPPVLDGEGQALLTNKTYYILPLIRGRGGGVRLANAGDDVFNPTCPLVVVQSRNEVDRGLPAMFTQVVLSPTEEIIRESTDINVKFITATVCDDSSVWKRDDYDNSLGQYFITTGGVEGFVGLNRNVTSRFKIKRYEIYGINTYKLVYCPDCTFCDHVCGDIGIVMMQNGMRRLALRDEDPFLVTFHETGPIPRAVQ